MQARSSITVPDFVSYLRRRNFVTLQNPNVSYLNKNMSKKNNNGP
jgi:hypothetical protein